MVTFVRKCICFNMARNYIVHRDGRVFGLFLMVSNIASSWSLGVWARETGFGLVWPGQVRFGQARVFWVDCLFRS